VRECRRRIVKLGLIGGGAAGGYLPTAAMAGRKSNRIDDGRPFAPVSSVDGIAA